MRKSSLILLLAMAFVLTTVAAGFSSTVIDGPCKELCTKCWMYDLNIEMYDCKAPTQTYAGGGCICPTFDFESSDGYCGSNNPYQTKKCPNGKYNNAPGVILKVCDCPDVVFDITKSYGIRIEILSPASGVYFTNTNVSDDPSWMCNPAPAACGSGANSIYVSSLADTTDEGTYCPEACDGTPFALAYAPTVATDVLYDDATHGPTGTDECCLDCIGNLARSISSTCLQPFMISNSPYIMIDIPTFVFDPKIVSEGDEVVIKVIITGETGQSVCPTCNDLCDCTQKIGVFGCPTTPPASECNTCFPYFTDLSAAGWWSGFALTNSGDADANVKMTFTAGGESVAVEFTVPAQSVTVQALSEITLLGQLAGKGSLYAEAVSTVPSGDGTAAASISGFAIMGDGAQAYGYLSKYGLCGCK